MTVKSDDLRIARHTSRWLHMTFVADDCARTQVVPSVNVARMVADEPLVTYTTVGTAAHHEPVWIYGPCRPDALLDARWNEHQAGRWMLRMIEVAQHHQFAPAFRGRHQQIEVADDHRIAVDV